MIEYNKIFVVIDSKDMDNITFEPGQVMVKEEDLINYLDRVTRHVRKKENGQHELVKYIHYIVKENPNNLGKDVKKYSEIWGIRQGLFYGYSADLLGIMQPLELTIDFTVTYSTNLGYDLLKG